MKKSIRYVGLDVHAEKISVAVAEGDEEPVSIGDLPNEEQYITKLVKKLRRKRSEVKFCYEAGPCGYVLYWQLIKLGVDCDVVAPSLIPVKPGDRVKTDKRDARNLAGLFRAGQLTPVWVPDAAHEALRDLVRAREAAKQDQQRARVRLTMFLLRRGRRRPAGVKRWTRNHLDWLATQKFEEFAEKATFLDYRHEVEHADERIKRLERSIDQAIEKTSPEIQVVIAALQAMRGVAQITAATVVAELGMLSRFDKPSQLMGYCGSVPSEKTTGYKPRRGAITKAGNAHLRRVLGEAAWSYRLRPNRGAALKKRQEGLSEEVKAIAWKAQHRLHHRYWALVNKGKIQQVAITAVARELIGFIWAIGVQAERELAAEQKAAA